MKQSFLIIFIFLFIFRLSAKHVDQHTAANVGIAYYYEHVNQFKNIQLKDIKIKDTHTEFKQNTAVYYIFNLVNNGYIIVSADDNITPVIGYSYESELDLNQAPENLKYWLDYTAEEIYVAINNQIFADLKIQNDWNYYLTRDASNLNVRKDKAVSPLLSCNWDQGKYYNQFCPVASGGPDGKALVGCVAVSMAQVMYYYRYPNQGNGNHGGINFGTTTYYWDNMVDMLANYNSSVATVLYHAGKAVDMYYTATGSGANTSDCPYALKTYFRYNSNCSYASKYLYTTTNWKNLMKTNLDNSRPLIYSGSDPSTSGHAWNCDGYDASDKFHMNWGWSGYANGFYAIDNLSAGGNNFTDYIGMVHSIYPPTTSYPYNCTGMKTLNYTVGSFEDGSGNSNYQGNLDCSWLISPSETVSKVVLSFVKLSTEASSDVITVYDGNSTSAPVLGTFSGNSLPNEIYSTGPSMLVRFQTNGANHDAGWLVSYRSIFPTYCSGLATLTAQSGNFSDGSSTDNYSYNHTCRWSITPQGGYNTIILGFNSFGFATNDSLRIYDQNTNQKLDSYSGTSIPPVKSYNTNKLLILFKTDSYLNGQGFDAYYNAGYAGIDGEEVSEFVIFPNPVTGNIINVKLLNDVNQNFLVSIYSVTGKLLMSDNIENKGSEISIPVDRLSPGIYVLQLKGSDFNSYRKFIIQ